MAVAATVALGACGSSHGSSSGAASGAVSSGAEATKTADQIVADAQHAFSGVSTVHIVGSVKSGGSNVQLDVVADHGRGGGTITANGLTFQTILDSQELYLKGDRATWTKAANASVANLLADKWIKTTIDNQQFGEFKSLLDVSQFASNFSPSGSLSKGSVTRFDGVEVVPVVDHSSDGGTMYVANSGSPYIVALVAPGGNNQGSLHLSQYGTAAIPSVPSGAIDLNQLLGRSG